MQITADVTDTLKAAQRDLTFISNVLSEFSIYFAWFSIFLSEMNVAIFAKIGFYQGGAALLCVSMRGLGLRPSVWDFGMAFGFTGFSFCGALFGCILASGLGNSGG